MADLAKLDIGDHAQSKWNLDLIEPGQANLKRREQVWFPSKMNIVVVVVVVYCSLYILSTEVLL